MELVTFLLASLILVFSLYRFLRHDPRLPPCPAMPLPIVGHLLYMDKNPRPQFKRWRQQCGDVFSIYLGQYLAVVINGYDLIKEVLVKHGDQVLDRPYVFFDAATGERGLGVAFSSGAVWKEQRALTTSILRALGMVNKNILAERVTEGAVKNIETIVNLNGRATDLGDIIMLNLVNIICGITLGHQFSLDDEEFIKGCNMYRDNISKGGPKNMANYLKFWSYLPGDMFSAKEIQTGSHFFMSRIVEPFIHQKGYKEYDENNLDTFIVRYIYEWNKKKKTGEPSTMSHANLNKVVYDLLGGAMETTATTFLWCIVYLLHYPHMQEKLFSEIDREIGTERFPSVDDRDQLPYVSAFIYETQRIGSIVPFSLPRMNATDLTIGGYLIPKGTQIMISLDSILFDKTLWGADADVFKPERFLDQNGKVKCPEHFVPFSIGKRACAGEYTAKVELFLFLASMIQRFKFLPDESAPLPSLVPEIGITACPSKYKVRAVDRKLD